METTTETVRQNQGYIILQAQTVGNKEIVLGENPKAPSPYVTWMCRDGTDYYFGHYASSLLSASKDFMKRVNRELVFLKEMRGVPLPSTTKEHRELER